MKNLKYVRWIDHYITVDTTGLTNGTIGTTNGTIGTNVSTNGNNGTIGYRETFRVLWLPMVPLATNGTIGKISNGTIGRIPNARTVWEFVELYGFVNLLSPTGIAQACINLSPFTNRNSEVHEGILAQLARYMIQDNLHSVTLR